MIPEEVINKLVEKSADVIMKKVTSVKEVKSISPSLVKKNRYNINEVKEYVKQDLKKKFLEKFKERYGE